MCCEHIYMLLKEVFLWPSVSWALDDGAKHRFLTSGMDIRQLTESLEKLCRWRLEGRVNPFQGGRNPLRPIDAAATG